MNIGEKIKKIRTAKLMTQKELVGSYITRNMLSQIESGSAQPSISTVTYIAERLKVSPGFLLADEEDEWLYFKSTEIGNIKKAYADRNFRLCREMCKNSEWADDELWLILAECCMRVGIEAFCNGYLRDAVSLFDESFEYCNKTIYNTDVIAAYLNAYFAYMRIISPTLSSNADNFQTDMSVFVDEAFCIYSKVFCDMEENGEYGDNIRMSDSSYAVHIESKKMINAGEYGKAAELLNKLLFDEEMELELPVLYFVFCDLEICCKEIGDFKGAYEYSQSKVALHQKMLS